MINPNCKSLSENSFLIGSATTEGIARSKKLSMFAEKQGDECAAEKFVTCSDRGAVDGRQRRSVSLN